MITLTKLRWSNLFSYGENNEIDFTKNLLTQVVGANGYGKSSIALILEEVLYNKNSKGIKKSDILNRNSKAKTYSIELEFSKDDDYYEIKTVRGSTQTVKLFKNGEDISSHTATGTYATIQSIITYDHKTFSQIVYQSSSASLEFLTATDGNRKKFLIELLGLSRYLEIGELFKEEAKKLSNNILTTSTKINSAKDWIKKYSDTSLEELELYDVPEEPKDLLTSIDKLKEELLNIEANNKKISQNNKYKELRDAIVLTSSIVKPDLDVNDILVEKTVLTKEIQGQKDLVTKLQKLGAKCPTCLQDVDSDKVEHMCEEAKAAQLEKQAQLDGLQKILDTNREQMLAWAEERQKIEEFEKYHGLYNPELSSELLSKESLEKEIEEKILAAEKIQSYIKIAQRKNNEVIAHNAKIAVIKSQIEEFEKDLVVLEKESKDLNNRNGIIQVLIKTFSPTGLVAYKIECLIKDLENLSNEYLSELSGGRFQLTFRISADKLNVVITDNGKDVEIYALSSGERARVNAAALLGIRKLMQSLSNSRINLLILDETIENLDIEGKEKLVEVLLNEEFLNTFIISHSFSHPLLERIFVTKTNNISRIEQ